MGKVFGLSGSRIQQIEKRALKHLRRQNRLEGLEDFYDFETEKYGR